MKTWVKQAAMDESKEEPSDQDKALMNIYEDDKQTVALDGYRLHATNEPQEAAQYPFWQPFVDNANATSKLMFYVNATYLKDALPPGDDVPILIRLTEENEPIEFYWQDPDTMVHHYAAIMPGLMLKDMNGALIGDLPWRPRDMRS
jgi:DNA polymerase III sliding clamp (beta) subunit (PCNA family)